MSRKRRNKFTWRNFKTSHTKKIFPQISRRQKKKTEIVLSGNKKIFKLYSVKKKKKLKMYKYNIEYKYLKKISQ